MKSTSAILAAALVGSSSAITAFTTTLNVGGGVTLTGLTTGNHVCFTSGTTAAPADPVCAIAATATDISGTAGCSGADPTTLTASTSTNTMVKVAECGAGSPYTAVGSAVAGNITYNAAVATAYTSGSPLTVGTASDVVIATTGLGASTSTAGLFLKIVEGTCASPTKTIAESGAVTATSTTVGTISINAAVGKATAAGRICTSATSTGTYADLGTPYATFAVNDAATNTTMAPTASPTASNTTMAPTTAAPVTAAPTAATTTAPTAAGTSAATVTGVATAAVATVGFVLATLA